MGIATVGLLASLFSVAVFTVAVHGSAWKWALALFGVLGNSAWLVWQWRSA
jgi:hypothetical protein